MLRIRTGNILRKAKLKNFFWLFSLLTSTDSDPVKPKQKVICADSDPDSFYPKNWFSVLFNRQHISVSSHYEELELRMHHTNDCG
jgi:hypothetical protein